MLSVKHIQDLSATLEDLSRIIQTETSDLTKIHEEYRGLYKLSCDLETRLENHVKGYQAFQNRLVRLKEEVGKQDKKGIMG